MTLAEFLLARIAEDEDVARSAAAHYDAADWSVGGREDYPVLWGYLPVRSSVDPGTIEPKVATHVARHGPARVLAECQAKRAIVEVFIDALDTADFPDMNGGIAWGLEHAVEILAVVHADHPDYDEEWRP